MMCGGNGTRMIESTTDTQRHYTDRRQTERPKLGMTMQSNICLIGLQDFCQHLASNSAYSPPLRSSLVQSHSNAQKENVDGRCTQCASLPPFPFLSFSSPLLLSALLPPHLLSTSINTPRAFLSLRTQRSFRNRSDQPPSDAQISPKPDEFTKNILRDRHLSIF